MGAPEVPGIDGAVCLAERGAERAVVDEAGLWERELEQNTSFAYRAELAGHVAQNRVVFIAPGGAVDELRFRPLDRWRFGLDLRYINFVVVPQLE